MIKQRKVDVLPVAIGVYIGVVVVVALLFNPISTRILWLLVELSLPNAFVRSKPDFGTNWSSQTDRVPAKPQFIHSKGIVLNRNNANELASLA